MLLLVREIQKLSDFKNNGKIDVCEIIAELDLLNCKELEEKARELDGENYNNKCFGINFNYVYDEDMAYINFMPNSIYYIDENGEKNYFKVEPYLINNIQRIILFEVRKFIKDKEKYVNDNKIEYQVI